MFAALRLWPPFYTPLLLLCPCGTPPMLLLNPLACTREDQEGMGYNNWQRNRNDWCNLRVQLLPCESHASLKRLLPHHWYGVAYGAAKWSQVAKRSAVFWLLAPKWGKHHDNPPVVQIPFLICFRLCIIDVLPLEFDWLRTKKVRQACWAWWEVPVVLQQAICGEQRGNAIPSDNQPQLRQSHKALPLLLRLRLTKFPPDHLWSAPCWQNSAPCWQNPHLIICDQPLVQKVALATTRPNQNLVARKRVQRTLLQITIRHHKRQITMHECSLHVTL